MKLHTTQTPPSSPIIHAYLKITLTDGVRERDRRFFFFLDFLWREWWCMQDSSSDVMYSLNRRSRSDSKVMASHADSFSSLPLACTHSDGEFDQCLHFYSTRPNHFRGLAVKHLPHKQEIQRLHTNISPHPHPPLLHRPPHWPSG